MTTTRPHAPVMVDEVLAFLRPVEDGLFVDCTVGAGGHARALLEAGAGRVLGLDRDPAALRLAAPVLAPWGSRVELVHSDFRRLPEVLEARGIQRIDGALADLGVSSMQLEGEGRGFSFRRDEPLDMRMDPTSGATAADMLQEVSEETLADVIHRFGEERHARRVARAIVAARRDGRLSTTAELAMTVRRAIPGGRRSRIDPATRTFQALRIWVNQELEGVDKFLGEVLRRLRAGARLVVLTFHSLEDRIVKHTLRDLVRAGEALRILTPRPVRPGDVEIATNPRSRSAKLRAAERLV